MKGKKILKFKGISTLLIILAMIGLFMCFGGITATASDPNVAISISDTEPCQIWDPAEEASDGLLVLMNIYETLLRYDALEKKIIPVLATGYTKSDDGMSWTFFIRRGFVFMTVVN